MSIPPENGIFLFRRQIPETIVAGSDPNETAEKLFWKDPNQRLETDPVSGSINIDMDFGEQYPSLKGFALINHGLISAASVKLRYNNAGFTELFVAYDSITITGNNDYVLVDREYRYVRLEITNLPDGAIVNIGELFPATDRLQFPHNYSWKRKKIFRVQKQVDRTDDGVSVEIPDEDLDPDPPEGSEFIMRFDDVGGEHFDDYKKLIRIGKKVYIPDGTKPECHYGHIPNNTLDSSEDRGGGTFSIEFWEDAT